MARASNETDAAAGHRHDPRTARPSRSSWIIVAAVVLAALIFFFFYHLSGPGPRDASDGPTAEDRDRTEAGRFDLPVVQVKSGRAEYDFGYVETETKHSVVFAIENRTGHPLRVRRVRSECRCIKVPNPPSLIGPAGTTNVKVDLEAPKNPITYSERVVIQTEGPNDPLIVLRIKARVGMPLAAEPPVVKLGELVLGEHRRGSLTIVNHGKEDVRPLYATSTNGWVAAQVPRASIPSRGRLRIPVVAKAFAARPTRHGVTVHIHTDSRRQPVVAARVEYAVAPEFSISQGSIELGRLETGQRREFSLEVTTTQGDPGRFITKCSAEGLRNVAVVPRVTYDGKRATVRCVAVAGNEPGQLEGVVRIELEGHENPIEVGVTGTVSDPATMAARQ